MPDVSAALRTRLKELEEPTSLEAVGLRLRGLLSHYWAKDEPDEIRRLALSDWMRIFSAYPLWMVDMACIRHLQGPNAHRRPMPADILKEIPGRDEP